MKRDENLNVEYKESWHDKYLEWICGYANAKGGTLYIGIEDRTKRVVGVRKANKLMEDIYDDRLEVVSPGGMFDGGLPIQKRDNLRDVGSSRRNPLVADIFSRLEFAERRGSGIGKMLDAYSLPLANPRDRKPSFVSDTFFRVILPNLTYGLTKEELVSFAERQSIPNSRTPNSRAPNSRTPNSRTPNGRPDKSYPTSRIPQVNPTSRIPNSHTPNRRRKVDRGLIRILLALDKERGSAELNVILGLKNRTDLYMRFLLPALQQGLIEYTIPNKPNSRLQKYRLTDKGRAFVEESQE